MRRDYRDGGGRDARDAAGLTDGARPAPAAFLDDLAREAGDRAVVEALRDRAARKRPQALEPLSLAHDVALVAHAALENALFLARELRERPGRQSLQVEHA